MNKVLLILVVAMLAVASCKKKDDCVTDKKCLEYPPKDELCDAAFEMWFYNSTDGECYKKGYSGCDRYGFETEEECKKCACEKDSKTTEK